MEDGKRTKQIQSSMDRNHVLNRSIYSDPVNLLKEESGDFSVLFIDIHSDGLDLRGFQCDPSGVCLHQGANDGASFSPCRLIEFSDNSMDMVEVCFADRVWCLDPLFSYYGEDSGASDSAGSQCGVLSESYNGDVSCLGDSGVSRRLPVLLDSSSNLIQLSMGDSILRVWLQRLGEQGIMVGDYDGGDIHSIGWDGVSPSGICRGALTSISERCRGLHLGVHLRVYPINLIRINRAVLSIGPLPPQCSIQPRLCGCLIDRGNLNRDISSGNKNESLFVFSEDSISRECYKEVAVLPNGHAC